MRILHALVVAAALAIAVPAANANFTAVFTGNTGNTFNYTLRFTVDQAGEQLRTGDFITIYDLSPLANLVSVTAPAGFSVAAPLTGVTPPGLGPPAIVDSPTLENVTFTYSGATRTTAFDFTGAIVVTNDGYTSTQLGKAAGTTSFTTLGDQLSTNVTTVPALVPEPASLAVLALGGLALLARRRSA